MKRANIKESFKLSFDDELFYTKSRMAYTYEDDTLFFGSQEELNALLVALNNSITSELKENDIVFFSKNVKFPKLLLKDLGTGISRTIKKEKCTKLVTDFKLEEMPKITEGWYVISTYGNNSFVTKDNLQEMEITLEEVIKLHPGIYTPAIVLHKFKLDEETANDICENCDKVVNYSTFTNYVNDHLPKLEGTQKDTILSMIRSQEPDMFKLGLNTIVGFNIKSVAAEFIMGVCNDDLKYNYFKSNINGLYTLNLLKDFTDYIYQLRYLSRSGNTRKYVSTDSVFRMIHDIKNLKYIPQDQKDFIENLALEYYNDTLIKPGYRSAYAYLSAWRSYGLKQTEEMSKIQIPNYARY